MTVVSSRVLVGVASQLWISLGHFDGLASDTRPSKVLLHCAYPARIVNVGVLETIEFRLHARHAAAGAHGIARVLRAQNSLQSDGIIIGHDPGRRGANLDIAL